jgi:ribosomal protein S18 acetylase RimI-like enzyme
MTSSDELDARHLGLFWMLRLDEPLPAAPAPLIPAAFLRADPSIAGEVATAMGFDQPAPVVQRFQRGCHCYIVRVEGEIASYGWVTFDEESIGELGLKVRLLPGEAYIWDCGTLPAYQGRRLYASLLAHIQRELQGAGFHRIWIGMDVDNLPSRAGVARAGFHHILDILQRRAEAARTLFARACPGVPEEDIQAAQYALLGVRGTDRIELPEAGG